MSYGSSHQTPANNSGGGRRVVSSHFSQESQVHLLADTDSVQGTLENTRYVSPAVGVCKREGDREYGEPLDRGVLAF